jgi:hypothetical protein
VNSNRIGPTRNPVAEGAGDARMATPTPAGAQEHLESAPGFPARRPRSPADDDSSRNVRPRQAQPPISELQIIPLGPSSFPDTPGFPDIAPRFLERRPSFGWLADSPTSGGSPDGGSFRAALESYEAAVGQLDAAHSQAGTSVSQSTLHQQEVWQQWARSRESSPAGLADLPLVNSPRGNWLPSALQGIEAALREREAAHPRTGPSAPQVTVHQVFAQQHRWSMNLPVTAGMPALSVQYERTTSFQITVGRSDVPPGGGNPVRQVPPGQSPLLPSDIRRLPIPAGDDALIGQLSDAQPPDPQVSKKQVALHRLSHWLHESGNDGLEKLRAQSPETQQKVVNDFLADVATRHSSPDFVVEPAPREIVDILHDGLQALAGVREASASAAVVTSSQQLSIEAEIDRLILRHF